MIRFVLAAYQPRSEDRARSRGVERGDAPRRDRFVARAAERRKGFAERGALARALLQSFA
jgi:hypothetical protein